MAYGLLAPREPTHQPLTWLDNPKTIGLLSAALGILANNKGNYGAFGPAVGAGGLLGLQAALGTKQNNINNRRDERTDKRRDYFARGELDLRRKEFGLKESDVAAERRAGGLIGNILGGYGDGGGTGGGPGGNVAQIYGDRPIDTSRPIIDNKDGTFSTERTITIEAGGRHFLIPTIVNGNQISPDQAVEAWRNGSNNEVGVYNSAQEAEQAALSRSQQIGQTRGVGTVPTHEVEGGAPWEAIDAQLLQLDDLVKQDSGIVNTEAYKKTYERLQKNRDFLSKQNEVKTLPGEPGVFYREGMGKPYEWVDDGSGGLKKRFVSTKEINERGLKRAESGATRLQQNVNAYAPASEEAQKDFIKSTRATYDQLKHAPSLLNNIEAAKALIPQAKGFMGTGGETLLEATKFLNNRLGMTISTEGVKSAEELRSRIFFNIMDNLKKMDAQPSQQQQQVMQESLGKLGTDPNALPAVLDAFSDVIYDKTSVYNKEVQGAIERGVKFPYDPIVHLEERKSGAAPGKLMKGQVVDGYKYKGGDPSKESSWEKQ